MVMGKARPKARVSRAKYPRDGTKLISRKSGRVKSPTARYREPIVEMMKEKIKNG